MISKKKQLYKQLRQRTQYLARETTEGQATGGKRTR